MRGARGRPGAATALCAVLGLALLTGCANLAPDFERPPAPVPSSWTRTASATTDIMAAADIDWRAFILDERLRQVVQMSLQNNRDLRVAVLNIERSRALHRIERSAALPELGAQASRSQQRSPSSASAGGQGSTSTLYSVELGLSRYEIDFFGRIRNLGDAALETFFAVQENRRALQISLVADVCSAWLVLAADRAHFQLARDTLASQQASHELTRRTHDLGGTSGLVLAQAQTTVDAARIEVARLSTQVTLDRHALDLLVGAALADALLPGPGTTGSAADADRAASLLVEVPAGLPSELLQRRPDVLAAEHLLRAANADIGAARAALFPSISLTGAAGTQSRSLAGLFSAGSLAWNFVPQIDLPIFDSGRRQANLHVSEAQQAIEVARYEAALQVAFREVADALGEREWLAERLAAQTSLTQATARVHALSTASFRNGAVSYLDVLDAQRSLYAAQQNSITLRLVEQINRIALYRALGGGWSDADAAVLPR
jgi:multidrug efflux system outer membrane protein